MYRLLKLRNSYLQNLQGVTVSNLGNLKYNFQEESTCSLCQKLHNFQNVFTRSRSTYTNPDVKHKKPRKKRIKSIKQYADLVIVTNQSSREHKASVKKITPADLKIFATTDFDLSEFYKLKAYRKQKCVEEHTYHNLTVIESLPTSVESIPSTSESGNKTMTENNSRAIATHRKATLDAIKLTQDSKIVNMLAHEHGIPLELKEAMDGLEESEVFEHLRNNKPGKLLSFQPEILEDHHEIPEVVLEDHHEIPEVVETQIAAVAEAAPIIHHHNHTAREEVISKTLAAYIDINAFLKTPQRGLNALIFHRSRTKTVSKNYPPLKNVTIYNAALKGFAAQGDYQKVQEILTFANEDNVELNSQSYAIIFECLGRVDCRNSHLKQIRIHSKEAFKRGLSFDRIMDEAVFLADQRNMVLRAMHSYDPTYVVKFKEPNWQYNNHLVNGLNHDDQLKAPKNEMNSEKEGIFTSAELGGWVKQQIEAERHGYVSVKSIELKSKPTEEIVRYRQAFDEHIKLWEKAAHEAFNRDLAALTARRSVLTLEPYLRSMPAKDFVQIITEEAKKLAQGSETYSPTCHLLYKDLGNKVYIRYKVLRKQKLGVLDKIIKIHGDYCNQYAGLHDCQDDPLPTHIHNYNTRHLWQWIEYLRKGEGATILTDHEPWVPTVVQRIGKFLYHIIMHDLKIDVNAMRARSKHKNFLPGFYTIFRNQGRVVKEEVKPHPVLSKLYRASAPENLTFSTNEVPMRCPPVPWSTVTTGGYLVAPCEMVRLPMYAVAQKQKLDDAVPNDIYPSLDSLNQLGAVPWKVNTQILDVILEVFNTGGSSRLDVPQPPSALPPPQPSTTDSSKTERYQLFRQRLQHKRKKSEMYSLWCDCLYRLSLANHFRKDVFWLPHNMDFRGRVYPIPPHLNHLGSDLARSMLVFAESRPLGPHGFDWLKVHLVNLTGLKKRERVSDRLIFANEIMDKILDSADYPLTGKMWWAESEEPWQTLACCMEVAAAHRSPDPEEFRSHFPVHQDGSCNGLQHYAALGRDSAGAHSVNLTPSVVPQDVYSAVVTLVEKQRIKDAENGVEIAKVLEGFVKRKVIKQTIMTTVYGVTRFGARLQIARQLKDLDKFPKEHVWAASTYLTGRTFESLRTMFTSTREIQDWFTECARLISSVSEQHVEWVTPLGFPIVQPYNRYRRMNSLNTVYEPFCIDKYEKPNVLKQKNAFPPNFIHSLDSTHMMLTSLHCERAGIVFVSVHDCYWTHPSTVDMMNKICREQFVALHSEPILEDLSLSLTEKYSYNNDQFTNDGSVTDLTKRKLNKVLRQLPKTGDFNINEVLESTYFFS